MRPKTSLEQACLLETCNDERHFRRLDVSETRHVEATVCELARKVFGKRWEAKTTNGGVKSSGRGEFVCDSKQNTTKHNKTQQNTTQ